MPVPTALPSRRHVLAALAGLGLTVPAASRAKAKKKKPAACDIRPGDDLQAAIAAAP